MIDALKPLIRQFLPFAQERMGFEHPPRLFVRQDADNAANPLGKTAYYDPEASSVTLYITNRHPKDVMRSLSHELVHHTQHGNGEFENAGEMGEGYAQNNPHMREMERQAYEVGNLCFRDWEDSIKGTIYNEHLQKGVEKNMSTKDWKNGELNSLLLEKWGFKFDLGGLNENIEPEEGIEEEEEELEEGFEHPKSATGSGPTNKGGKIERSDVANKDTSKFGQGSGGGKKTSAGGTNTPPKAGKVDRSDVANKASGRWLKEEDELEEMCPMDHGGGEADVMVVGDEGPEEGGSPEDRAVELVDELRDLLMQLTGGEEGEMVEEPVEERRGRGRKGPHTRGTPDPRLREGELRELVREALKIVMERKK